MLEKLPDALGHALRHQRAGLDKLLFSLCDLRQGTAAIEVTSPAFADHAPLPAGCTADGPGVSPPLQWRQVPAGAASVLLIVEDADAPTPQPLVHAIAVDLPPGDGELAEGALSATGEGDAPDPALHVGRNSALRTRWLPPDPPPGHGVHRYAFQVFALGPGAQFGGTPGRDAVAQALRDHALASGLLIGTYERPDGSVREPATQAAATPAATAVLDGAAPA